MKFILPTGNCGNGWRSPRSAAVGQLSNLCWAVRVGQMMGALAFIANTLIIAGLLREASTPSSSPNPFYGISLIIFGILTVGFVISLIQSLTEWVHHIESVMPAISKMAWRLWFAHGCAIVGGFTTLAIMYVPPIWFAVAFMGPCVVTVLISARYYYGEAHGNPATDWKAILLESKR